MMRTRKLILLFIFSSFFSNNACAKLTSEQNEQFKALREMISSHTINGDPKRPHIQAHASGKDDRAMRLVNAYLARDERTNEAFINEYYNNPKFDQTLIDHVVHEAEKPHQAHNKYGYKGFSSNLLMDALLFGRDKIFYLLFDKSHNPEDLLAITTHRGPDEDPDAHWYDVHSLKRLDARAYQIYVEKRLTKIHDMLDHIYFAYEEDKEALENMNLIWLATYFRHVYMVRALCARHVDLNITGSRNSTALQLAFSMPDGAVIADILLKAGADVFHSRFLSTAVSRGKCGEAIKQITALKDPKQFFASDRVAMAQLYESVYGILSLVFSSNQDLIRRDQHILPYFDFACACLPHARLEKLNTYFEEYALGKKLTDTEDFVHMTLTRELYEKSQYDVQLSGDDEFNFPVAESNEVKRFPCYIGYREKRKWRPYIVTKQNQEMCLKIAIGLADGDDPLAWPAFLIGLRKLKTEDALKFYDDAGDVSVHAVKKHVSCPNDCPFHQRRAWLLESAMQSSLFAARITGVFDSWAYSAGNGDEALLLRNLISVLEKEPGIKVHTIPESYLQSLSEICEKKEVPASCCHEQARTNYIKVLKKIAQERTKIN